MVAGEGFEPPTFPIGAVETERLAVHKRLLSHGILLAHAHQRDLDRRLDDDDLNTLLILGYILKLFGRNLEVLLEFVVQDFQIVVGEEDITGVLSFADGA